MKQSINVGVVFGFILTLVVSTSAFAQSGAGPKIGSEVGDGTRGDTRSMMAAAATRKSGGSEVGDGTESSAMLYGYARAYAVKAVESVDLQLFSDLCGDTHAAYTKIAARNFSPNVESNHLLALMDEIPTDLEEFTSLANDDQKEKINANELRFQKVGAIAKELIAIALEGGLIFDEGENDLTSEELTEFVELLYASSEAAELEAAAEEARK